MQDEPVQSARATRLIEHELSDREPGCIADALVVEGASEARCARTITFAKAAVKLGMALLR